MSGRLQNASGGFSTFGISVSVVPALFENDYNNVGSIVIDYRQMNWLASKGMTAFLAVNGPNKGNPKHSVLATFLPLLEQFKTQPEGAVLSVGMLEDQIIDPALIGLIYCSDLATSKSNYC